MTAAAPEQPVLSAETLPAFVAPIAADLETNANDAAALVVTGWLAGAVTTAEFIDVVAHLIEAASTAAMVVADAIAARLLGTAPVGISPTQADLRRWTKAARAITADLDKRPPQTLESRTQRLASSEAVASLQRAMQEAYAAHGVTGYRRGLDADPCELCQWLYKDGFVYPINRPMHKHPGCQCVPIPTTEAPKYKSGRKRR